MGYERNLSAVPPISLTENGGAQGQLTLSTTLGLFVKQIIQIQASTIPATTVQIKKVLNNTQIIVGPKSSSMTATTNLTAYTVALGSFIFAEVQPKSTLPNEERLYGSYIQEPSNSWRVTPVDSYGNSIDSTNPFAMELYPVQSQIPFTLGNLALPAIITELMSNLNYDQVISTNALGIETLTFNSGGSTVAVIELIQTSSGWQVQFGLPGQDFLLQENGGFFELENGTGEILLET